MLAQQTLPPPATRLPPSGSPPGLGFDLQQRYGNAGLLELLRSGEAASGDYTTQRAEPIGESGDEWAVGGAFDPKRGGFEWRTPGAAPTREDFLYAQLGIDEASLKLAGGLFAMDDGTVDVGLVGGESQVGVWEDDEGHWGGGLVAHGYAAELGANLIGDPDEPGGYLRFDGQLLSGDTALYLGEDGHELSLGGAAMEAGLEAGTGADPSCGWDTSIGVSCGFSAGEASQSLWTDVDQDGVGEMNLGFGLGAGLGFQVDVNSEIAGQVAEYFSFGSPPAAEYGTCPVEAT